jgi:multisubunit Na+/H+ antiporter MnhF subunit
MRHVIPAEPARALPSPAATRLVREPSLAERVAALDRLTAWPTLRLRCALRRPG